MSAIEIRENRAKVYADGTNIDTDFILQDPIHSFSRFSSGVVNYIALSASGEWQVAIGVVTGNNLTRGTVQENHLGTTDQIDFTGMQLHIAQVISADFMNDLTDSKHDHSNKNILDAITAEFTVEEKAKLLTIEEGATQDQDATDITVTPVGSITSVNVQDALEELDTDITNNASDIANHVHAASIITYDETDNDITSATNLQDALDDHANVLDQRIASSSGIITGLSMLKLSAYVFQINIGEGAIYDNVTDPTKTTVTSVVVGTELTPTINYGSYDTNVIHVFLTSTGQVLQKSGEILPIDYRENIYLGRVYVVNGEISDIANAPVVIKQTATDVQDLMQKSQAIVSGGGVGPVTGLLKFYGKSAKIFSHNINFRNDRTNPNEFITLAKGTTSVGVDFYTINHTDVDSIGTVSVNKIPTVPLAYNPSGSTITALAAGESTIHRIYSLGLNGNSREYFLLYGQNIYASAAEAKSLITTDIVNTDFPLLTTNLNLEAYICVSDTSTNFDSEANSWILNDIAQFGSAGGGNSPLSVEWGAITGSIGSQLDLALALSNKEDSLGTPSVDNQVLVSTTGDVRSWATLDKTAVGLDNVDNTSDADKPISTSTQTALDLKAPIDSPVLTGVPEAPTPTSGDSSTKIATTNFVQTEITTNASKVISDTPPVNPSSGKEWTDSTTMLDYTWYEDGDSGQWVQINGKEVLPRPVNSYAFSVLTLNVDATISLNYFVNFLDCSLGNRVFTLPTAVGNRGIVVNLKRVDNTDNTCTIITTASELIDTHTGATLIYNQNLQVVSDGTNWRIL